MSQNEFKYIHTYTYIYILLFFFSFFSKDVWTIQNLLMKTGANDLCHKTRQECFVFTKHVGPIDIEIVGFFSHVVTNVFTSD